MELMLDENEHGGRQVWAPEGQRLSDADRFLLSVSISKKPSSDLYWILLAQKFQELIDADPAQALADMQMSVEHAPGLWAISHECDRRHWGTAIVGHDLMMPLLAKIDWAAPGSFIDEGEVSLGEMLERL